jgi:poly-beta-1,6-N-acetyl-D-glucosamine synthase
MEIQGSVFEYITISILALTLALQLYYWLFYYLRASHPYMAEPGPARLPVSVIICARDEAANLREFLPAVLQQDYPDYEVIVVNDCSEDETDMVLAEFGVQFPHLKISTIKKDPLFQHNKKLAQLIGIKAAKNEILLFTDADCRPDSDQWVTLMTSHLQGERQIVVGYGGYLAGDGLLNKYVRYDTMFIAMQYLGRALRGKPYMGVGRNLAYKKSFFLNSRGFSSHYHIPSGDDDLFVNANATPVNTAVETAPGSPTRSLPSTTFTELMKQKKRHMTTAKLYRFRDKLFLFGEPVSRLLFYASFVILLVMTYLWPIVLALFVIRAIIMAVVLQRAGKRLGEEGLTLPSLFFDIAAPFINSLFYLSTLRNRAGNKAWR